MPDFTIEVRPCCASCLRDERAIGDYQQVFTRMPKGHPFEYDWTCTCKGYQFRQTCKHVKQSASEHCGWNGFHDDGEPIDGKCPRCGGDATAMNHAV